MRDIIMNGNVRQMRDALESGSISAVELTRAYLDNIQALDGEIGAYITVTAERALEDAERIDRRRLAGESLPPLAGIPFGVKDNISTRGVLTTCASRMLLDYVPPYDATVIERLNSQGGIMLGKLNMDEFAMGSATDTSVVGITRNPLDVSRTAGGSSGGAAAAVSSGMAAYALGSDTGGSVRQPAAFCGAVGIKPTYGTVSRYGLIAFAPSLEQIAPITRDVYSSALVLSALAGRDERDATTYCSENSFTSEIDKGVSGLCIGIDEAAIERATDDVRGAIFAAIRRFELMGARTVTVSTPDADALVAAYYVICTAEASSNLARFDGVRYGHRADGARSIDELFTKSRTEGFGDEVKRRIMLGTYFLDHSGRDAYYKKALSVRRYVTECYERIFETVDAVISPVAPTVAYRLSDKKQKPLEIYRDDAYTVAANVTGLPALTLPCGAGEGGMPVGLQLMGAAFSEALLYRIAYAFEGEGARYERKI